MLNNLDTFLFTVFIISIVIIARPPSRYNIRYYEFDSIVHGRHYLNEIKKESNHFLEKLLLYIYCFMFCSYFIEFC